MKHHRENPGSATQEQNPKRVRGKQQVTYKGKLTRIPLTFQHKPEAVRALKDNRL